MSAYFAFLLLAQSAGADDNIIKMATLYENVCLDTFPDDDAVEALMLSRNAIEASPEDVKITMGDDPARSWNLADGSASVWLEFPPYHACSVRWNTPTMGDLSPYSNVVENYVDAHGEFGPIKPMDVDQGDIHISLDGQQRTLPDESTESLFMVVQNISDEKRRAEGETGLVLRFVHQFTLPPEEPK